MEALSDCIVEKRDREEGVRSMENLNASISLLFYVALHLAAVPGLTRNLQTDGDRRTQPLGGSTTFISAALPIIFRHSFYLW